MKNHSEKMFLNVEQVKQSLTNVFYINHNMYVFEYVFEGNTWTFRAGSPRSSERGGQRRPPWRRSLLDYTVGSQQKVVTVDVVNDVCVDTWETVRKINVNKSFSNVLFLRKG